MSTTSLTLGLNACFDSSYCLSNASWENEISYYTNVTISQRQATVVFSRADNTTLDVQTIGAPKPTGYDPLIDFFPIYNVAMNVTSNSATLAHVSSVASQVVIGNVYDVQALLRQFIAVPVALYNEPVLSDIAPPENQDKAGYLGIPAYQVIHLHFVYLKIDCHLFCVSLRIYIRCPTIADMVNYCPCSMYTHSISKFLILS